MPYFDAATETLPRDQLASLQSQKLRAMLEALWERNAFYTAKMKAAGVRPDDIRSVADISRLPVTTKYELVTDQLANLPYGTNLTYPASRYIRFHQTSGTTGSPLRVLDTDESWDWWGRCWGYVLSGAGLSAGDRIFTAFSFGPFIGFWASVEGARQIGAMMIPGGGRDSIQRLELMRDTGSTALCCTPTYALRLAEVARESNFDMSVLTVKSTVHAGEPGANVPSTKRRIQEAWSAKCYDHAGASEVGAHSFECEAQPGGTHAIESEYIVEVLDPKTGQPVPAGERGELVITNLGRWGYPVIRYRTGDVVQLNTEKCACGRTFARFEGGIVGRADDMVTVRGVNVFPAAVENIVRRFQEVDEFRVTVRTVKHMDEMDVEVELADGADSGVVGQIAQALDSALSFRPIVRVAARGGLPRFEMKAKRFFVERS
ncbi:MAG: phenylacetate--CoA ligase [Chloroflexi bacterium]|nr:phenylacetate--CoA ligase [Chloroflexota bacterium]